MGLGIPALHAAGISPVFDTFGPLPIATFGGTGIPNSNVAITTVIDGQSVITLGLTATQRYSSPALTNNGAGTFQAQPGDFGAPAPGYALWNFAFYADVPSGYSAELFFDTDPAIGNTVTTSYTLLPGLTQDSWNLGFGFLNTILGPTNGIAFDPTVDGEYSFALVVKNVAGGEVGRSAINVRAGNPVPDGGATLALLGSSLGLMAAARRKFRK